MVFLCGKVSIVMTSKQRDGVAEWPFDTGFITAPQNDRLIQRCRQIHSSNPSHSNFRIKSHRKRVSAFAHGGPSFYSITSGMKYTKPAFHQICYGGLSFSCYQVVYVQAYTLHNQVKSMGG
ncbi:hypothetical protein VNO80_23174 [Phaseolus coccineus]|uniref:Uncharacterized protein n=1 Tax=Phaseolus coccineus TaxID=3886 RepID=A0AAN9M5G2_PHACN